MRNLISVAGVTLFLAASTASQAAGISGEYLESRSCDVYTGPCFANGEMTLAGKEAILAWKVDEGKWNDTALDGLTAALVVRAEGTLGYDGVFPMRAGKTRSIILVDERANPKQQDALVAFVKDAARELTGTIAKVEKAPMQFKNDYVSNRGVFKAGKIAEIETRALGKHDNCCTNEIVYYQPLTQVENSSPAFSKMLSFKGEGLDSTWTSTSAQSTFLATFRR